MALLKWVLLLALAGYGVLLAAMYFLQRGLMYFPDPARKAPAVFGLPGATEVELAAADGVRLFAWQAAPTEGRPLIVYFQGNAGGLDLRAQRFGRLLRDGFGLLALNYRGYGGSGGAPKEAGLIRDALAAYDYAAAHVPPERIVLWGESLGTGIAVALAAERPVARVLLESPYTSTADVAAGVYWFLPVRLLMKDQFRSDLRVGKVRAPILVLHGDKDRVVPFRLGERLFDLIQAPKRMIRMPGIGHNDHDANGGYELVRSFLLNGL